MTAALKYLVIAYCIVAAALLYAARYAIFALVINPSSWPVFIIGICVLLLIVTAPIAGISYLRKPRVLKLVYFSLAAAVVAVYCLGFFLSA